MDLRLRKLKMNKLTKKDLYARVQVDEGAGFLKSQYGGEWIHIHDLKKAIEGLKKKLCIVKKKIRAKKGVYSKRYLLCGTDWKCRYCKLIDEFL